MTPGDRDRAVDEFIELVGAVDGILQLQSKQDAGYFAATCGRELSDDERTAVETRLLAAYRWQYILSGADHPHFRKVLGGLITDAQGERIVSAIGTLM